MMKNAAPGQGPVVPQAGVPPGYAGKGAGRPPMPQPQGVMPPGIPGAPGMPNVTPMGPPPGTGMPMGAAPPQRPMGIMPMRPQMPMQGANPMAAQMMAARLRGMQR